VAQLREELLTGLGDFGEIDVFEGRANFLLARIDRSGWDASRLGRELLGRGLAIRVCDNYTGLGQNYFRVAVRPSEEQHKLLQALGSVLRKSARAPKKVNRRPAIMFQGISSNAGKSILTAALCRILLQDGRRVAPFKAQNMSLNSFVTHQGGEMGRAQAVQAAACRLQPDVRMNPILLKPNSDRGSQIILNGQPIGNMEFGQYAKNRELMLEAVHEAYRSLSDEHEVIVIEGAGSPAEINLRDRDIVNMAMARLADAPVLLVGDIDRGGVFASFVGTMELLLESERRLVKGLVINKFRGDETLLGSAISYVEEHTGRPVLGIVPYIERLGLPEEDSVSFKALSPQPLGDVKGKVAIAAVDLPHISNFTDFDAFEGEPDVAFSIARSAEQLQDADVIIIPGSKNVIGDLNYLEQTGLGKEIVRRAHRGETAVVGICGGYQMLGHVVKDPSGVESSPGSEQPALDLLPMTTVLEEQKILVLTQATHLASGCALKGYEIHHGKTVTESLKPAVVREDGEVIGYGDPETRVWAPICTACSTTICFDAGSSIKRERERDSPHSAK
jgi:cobyric acid synthase CobQ